MSNISKYIKNYSYLVKFSSEDDSYLAQCLELVIIAHGDSQEEAIQEITFGETKTDVGSLSS